MTIARKWKFLLIVLVPFALYITYTVIDYYQPKLTTPEQIRAQATQRHGDLDLLSNGLYYQGSDDSFHYFTEDRVPGTSEFFKVRKESLALPLEFRRTKSRRQWVRCNIWFSKTPSK